jgi:hypothetical protein
LDTVVVVEDCVDKVDSVVVLGSGVVVRMSEVPASQYSNLFYIQSSYKIHTPAKFLSLLYLCITSIYMYI